MRIAKGLPYVAGEKDLKFNAISTLGKADGLSVGSREIYESFLRFPLSIHTILWKE